LHLGSALDRQWARDRAAQVRAQQPDLVVLLGDLVEGHGDAEAEHLSAFAGLGAPLGVWAVSGNHEAHNGGLRETALTGSGIRLLRNRWVQLRPGLVLAGVEDLTQAGRNGGGTKPLTQALAGRPPETATVLLSHTPWHADQAAREGVGLMLSGHTHGGQIWPFGYLVRIRYPFLEGRYTEQGMTVLVSRGTGTWGPRMRLWLPGQILRVTLRRGTSPVPAA
jgi:predicted MPP superfamily phosphohydrolase